MTGSSPLSNPSLLATLLAALSHELGSPLAAIKGAATTLLDYRQRLPDERIVGFLRSIDTQTDRLSDLLDDLVLLAKIQTGSLHLRPEPIALRRLIEQTLEPLPPDRRAGFLLEGYDPVVNADVPYLRRALTLLLRHFCETATDRPLNKLAVTTDAHVRFSGSSDRMLADPVAHLDQLIGSTDPGRGREAVKSLRLVLSRAVIELHGGEWIVEERSGDGPTLCVTLPLADHIAESE